MREWVGVGKEVSGKMAELFLVQGLGAIALPHPSALLIWAGLQPFSPYSIQIFHAMINPSALMNLENRIQTSFRATAVETSINPY